ncbi:MAG: FHA domain-containing protein [Gemmatimonadetes bacterium]|nr:FHA domain-containing protein [Gemmatimonadota bacterium]MCH8811232.1 FHA domain-containing protein [Gemmatimonadota bacterium]
MNARLTCLTGELSGIVHEVVEECVIGRDPGSQMVLPSGVVSGRHARIYAEGGAFYLQDLESRNGTSVDGMAVSHPVKLGRLNVISVAQTFEFVFHDPSVTADGEPSEAPMLPDSQEPSPLPDQPFKTLLAPFDVRMALPDPQTPARPGDPADDSDIGDQ